MEYCVKKKIPASILLVTILTGLVFLTTIPLTPASAERAPEVALQIPSATPSGPMAVVVPGNEERVNLRSGPGVKYELVGVLLVGQRVPAKGRSPAGEWILVEYPGVPGGEAWVYSVFVEIDPPGQLPIDEPPPPPTLQFTLTIDPTLAARFIVTEAPTRQPTFTQPAPLVIPTFTDNSAATVGNVPMGFIVVGLAALGILFGLISFVQGR